VTYRRRGAWFPGSNHQHAGHVVGAIPMLWSWLAIQGMFESASTVGHGDEMSEVRFGNVPSRGHTNASSAKRQSAKSTYSPATTDQPRVGARRDASAAMLAANSGRVSTLLSARAIASGSS
jgi:hypothetical protein